MEITFAVPTARDSDHLADIAGNLVEAMEETAGDLGPVVSGRFESKNSVLRIAVDAVSEDPTEAVSATLELISRVAQQAEIPLGEIHAISLSSDDAGIESQLASA